MNSKLFIAVALSIFLLGYGGGGGGDDAGATRPPVTAGPPVGQIGDGRLPSEGPAFGGLWGSAKAL